MKFFKLFFLLFTLSLWGQEVRLSTGNGYPPYTDENLPGGGSFTKKVRSLFSQAGLKASIEFMNFSKSYFETKNGKFLATFPWIVTEERKKDFYFSDPVMWLYGRFYIRKKDRSLYQKEADFHHKSFCIPHGYAMLEYLKRFNQEKKVKIFQGKDNLSCLKMLHKGRVDVVEVHRGVANYLIKRNPELSDLLEHKKFLTKVPLRLMFSKNSKESKKILNLFNKAIQKEN